MYIFVDESGSFTHSSSLNAWCIVAAYVAPEHQRRHIDTLMTEIREVNGGAETKLKHLTEAQYLSFLRKLTALRGAAFAVAVDVGHHRREAVEHHRDMQAAKVVEHRNKMLYEAGRRGITNLSEQVKALPPQLYTQLVCQFSLFHRIITRATLYFVQRHPPSLANFRWRLDQKARVPTRYEETFRIILPVILQTMSLRDPMMMLKEANYSHFLRFEYPPGQAPTYLKDEYGIEGEGILDIGKIIRDDFRLIDSASSSGVQVADLIASGIRRLLRGGFERETEIATYLGKNFLQPLQHENAVHLISLDSEAVVDERVTRLIRRMDVAARPMLTR